MLGPNLMGPLSEPLQWHSDGTESLAIINQIGVRTRHVEIPLAFDIAENLDHNL